MTKQFKHVKKSCDAPFDDAVAIPLDFGDLVEKKQALRDRIKELKKEISRIEREEINPILKAESEIAIQAAQSYIVGKGYPKGKVYWGGCGDTDLVLAVKKPTNQASNGRWLEGGRMVARYRNAGDGVLYLNIATPDAVLDEPKRMSLSF
jgi:hypothetical protein